MNICFLYSGSFMSLNLKDRLSENILNLLASDRVLQPGLEFSSRIDPLLLIPTVLQRSG